jgi:hypothetical protein
VTAAQVLADVVRIESGLVRSAPPSVNKFAAITPSMNIAREAATATLLLNGKVLVIGGYDPLNNVVVLETELYDPVTNTFAVLTPSLPGGSTTLLPNGKELVGGGTKLYDPATNTLASTPLTGTAYSAATATLLPNGKVLIAGGDSAQEAGNVWSSTDLYTP